MSSHAAAAPISADAGGGGHGRTPGHRQGQGRRRAKNRRYHRNRAKRSLLHIVGWNAEGLRSKIPELQSWLPSVKADVVAIQEAQLSANSAIRIPGFQPPVYTRRQRGRITGSTAKGGDVAIYVRGGIPFSPLTDQCTHPADDSTEICGIRLLTKTPIDIVNVYRPPIRRAPDDERQDHFDPAALPTSESTIILGDFNAHHPLWDHGCEEADGVGERLAAWLERVEWTALNTGEPTHSSYRSGGSSAPDAAFTGRALARRVTWSVGPDLGSDHLPMLLSIRTADSQERQPRKCKWAFNKANWVAFRAECEALSEADPQPYSAQELVTRFTNALARASCRHIPRGARPDAKPWALDPELQRAVAERREARRLLRADDPTSRERWIAAKQRAAAAEQEASRKHFRTFVETSLNKPANLGRVSKILKKWEGANDDHRPGQAMKENGRLLISDREKANAFNKTYAHVSRQTRVADIDKAAKRRLATLRTPSCQACGGLRRGCCGEFTMAELVRQLQRLQLRKAPGPDGICGEHLAHLGPIARQALLKAINASWLEGTVPTEWRRARIVPIPKAGKDKQLVDSYRPIALTSHLSKLTERLILARLWHLIEREHMVPDEQVGFRAGRSVENNIGRLIQMVQDGWNLPKSRRKNPPEGSCAQKYVLLAFDFARAYDTVDHRLLRVRLLELGLPLCYVTWIWQFLRDRRARVEYQSATSGERAYRAGLPQGSVLSPALFLLWAAPLAAELQRVPGTTAFMYADDTAALCAGNNITTARDRAQQAADVLVRWAQRSKMRVAGQKTQMLVLSQWARDADNCTIKVAGESVSASAQLKLLGITLDRLLHFGPHCRSLRQRVRPRIAQLRKLTGRDWGLEERQLRTVASGYVRGALEHAAAAWLPAASDSHVVILEREMRAAARVVTGCPISTPSHALMAEAGLAPVAERRLALAARLLAKARALPEGDPLRRVAEASAPSRLSTVTGWRTLGSEVWRAAGVEAPIEEALPPPDPPWVPAPLVTFSLTTGLGPPPTSERHRREAATLHLASLPQCAVWVWTDGSASEGVLNGGAGALIEWPDGVEREVRAPAGGLCSSFRAEMVALRSALESLLESPRTTEEPLIICTDSQSALASLRAGPAAQTTPLGIAIWQSLKELATNGRTIHLQWVPSHCGIQGNERVDAIAKEASEMDQETAAVDVRTVHRAAARFARARTIQAWPAGWYRALMGSRLPPGVTGGDRASAVEVHQLRAGHWPGSTQWRHRVGQSGTRLCAQCSDPRCSAALCPVCREEADTPEHVLLRCPALMSTRMRTLGTIMPRMEDVRAAAPVAALGAAHRTLQSRLATPR